MDFQRSELTYPTGSWSAGVEVGFLGRSVDYRLRTPADTGELRGSTGDLGYPRRVWIGGEMCTTRYANIFLTLVLRDVTRRHADFASDRDPETELEG